MDYISIITAVIGALAGGGLTAVFLIPQRKNEAIIKNLEQIIKDLREDAESRKAEKEEYKSDLEHSRSERNDLMEENTSVKFLMCVHMGCGMRAPAAGRGDNWYHEHKNDPALGVDYLPVNQLLKMYGMKKKSQNNDTDGAESTQNGEDAQE